MRAAKCARPQQFSGYRSVCPTSVRSDCAPAAIHVPCEACPPRQAHEGAAADGDLFSWTVHIHCHKSVAAVACVRVTLARTMIALMLLLGLSCQRQQLLMQSHLEAWTFGLTRPFRIVCIKHIHTSIYTYIYIYIHMLLYISICVCMYTAHAPARANL